jgi:hypothetical protein
MTHALKLALVCGVVLAAPAFATPAFAQAPAGEPPSDTVKLIVEKGMKLAVADMEFDLTFKTDGSYADPTGQGGKYRTDGKKLCMTPDAFGQEFCNDYPDGKKSGDRFEIVSDFGPMNVTVK